MKLELIEEASNNTGYDLDNSKYNVESEIYIGPAKVLELRERQVLISLHKNKVWALMALAYDYTPVIGDILLVLGKQNGWYVTGVIEGAGCSKWVVPKDLEISAPHGLIQMSAAKGIVLNTPKLDFISKKLRVVATSLIERIATVQRTVTETLDVHAKRVQIKVDTTHRVTAEKIRQRAKEDIKLNANKIHLG